nr:MAG TPA: hypothetical protein [Caudoviricetes sp.]
MATNLRKLTIFLWQPWQPTFLLGCQSWLPHKPSKIGGYTLIGNHGNHFFYKNKK